MPAFFAQHRTDEQPTKHTVHKCVLHQPSVFCKHHPMSFFSMQWQDSRDSISKQALLLNFRGPGLGQIPAPLLFVLCCQQSCSQ